MSDRGTIEIRNLKVIETLVAPVPKSGVWILTGENGAGKSALLTCLHRIGYTFAFRDHFPSSIVSPRLDSYSGAQISYTAKGRRVVYQRGDSRWVPRPRSNADVLDDFGFSGVIHIGATAERISPKPEDFDPSRSRVADEKVRNYANKIFTTKKFDDLRVVNVTRGVNEAYVLRKGARTPYSYISEKSFSVGELCVLKLLKAVLNAKSSSLVLIDELEIALHPTAQTKLYEVIKEISADRGLVSIFSTHSSTLIKIAKQRQILFVYKSGNSHKVCVGPQKSFVLGRLAGPEERMNDRIFVVEDDSAKALVRACMDTLCEGQDAERCPKYQIIRVGSWTAAIDTYRALSTQNDSISRICLLVDGDVVEAINEVRQRDRFDDRVKFFFGGKQGKRFHLPYAPECFFALVASKGLEDLWDEIKYICNDQQLARVEAELPETDGVNNREQCKTFLRAVVRTLEQHQIDDPEAKAYIAATRLAKRNGFAEWGALCRVVH